MASSGEHFQASLPLVDGAAVYAAPRACPNRRTGGGKRDRGQGYIVVAHELSRVGLSCCHNERDYSEQRPARPGSQAAREQEWEGDFLAQACDRYFAP